MNCLASVAASWRPAISALNTSACSPKAPLLSKTFLPWLYPMTPNPAVCFPFLSDRDPSEYMSRTSLLSQLATGCVTCHTSHGCVTHFRPILGNLVEVTLVTSPFMYIVSHAKGTSFP